MHKEFYTSHIDDCEYCNSVLENKSLSQDDKDKKVNDHVADAWGGLIDATKDRFDDEQLLKEFKNK